MKKLLLLTFAFSQQYGLTDLSINLPDYTFEITDVNCYFVPRQAFVTLKVFDIQGREMATLVSGSLPPGNYNNSFNASSLPGGIYFYQLKTVDFTQTKKLIIQ